MMLSANLCRRSNTDDVRRPKSTTSSDQPAFFRISATLLATAVGSAAHAFPRQGTIDVTVFRSDAPFSIPIPVNDLFGGWFKVIQGMSVDGYGYGLIAFLAVMISLRLCRPPMNQRVWEWTSITGVFLASALFSLKMAQGWDELFIGAKHAEAVMQANRFSYNLHNWQEGNTEFLPLLLTGLLAKLRLPLLETLMSVGLLGNLWLILATYKLFAKLTASSSAGLIYAAGVGVFPCVVITSMSGFYCCLFTAAALTSILLIFYGDTSKAQRAGWLLLAFLTLFRLEGALLACLVWLYVCVIAKIGSPLKWPDLSRHARNAVTTGLLLAAPFAVASLVRYLAFGHIIPPAVALKDAKGDPSYVLRGQDYFIGVVYAYNLQWVALAALPAVLIGFFRAKQIRKLLIAWILICVFSVPYLVGGGDWFPTSWARYLMPLILLTYFVLWANWSLFAKSFRAGGRVLQPLMALLLVIAPFATAFSSPQSRVVDSALLTSRFSTQNAFFFTRSTLEGGFLGSSPQGNPTVNMPYGWQWDRIQMLAFLGTFLKATTPESGSIASSEEATIMYYAHRDVVDLTGFSSPEIAFGKLDPLWQGDAMHRKRNPVVIAEYKPDIIALWEPAYLEGEPTDFKTDEAALRHYLDIYHRIGFSHWNWDIGYFRAGSYEYLRKLGYRPIVVGGPQAVMFYWVSNRIFDRHVAALQSLGCHAIGKKTLRYEVTPYLRYHYASGEELVPKLGHLARMRFR